MGHHNALTKRIVIHTKPQQIPAFLRDPLLELLKHPYFYHFPLRIGIPLSLNQIPKTRLFKGPCFGDITRPLISPIVYPKQIDSNPLKQALTNPLNKSF